MRTPALVTGLVLVLGCVGATSAQDDAAPPTQRVVPPVSQPLLFGGDAGASASASAPVDAGALPAGLRRVQQGDAGAAGAPWRVVDPGATFGPTMRDLRVPDATVANRPGAWTFQQRDAAAAAAGDGRGFMLEAPGFRARFDRPKMLSLTPDGVLLDRAPAAEGLMLPLVPENAVYDLSADLPDLTPAPLGENALDYRIDTRLRRLEAEQIGAPTDGAFLPPATVTGPDRPGFDLAAWLAGGDGPTGRQEAEGTRR